MFKVEEYEWIWCNHLVTIIPLHLFLKNKYQQAQRTVRVLKNKDQQAQQTVRVLKNKHRQAQHQVQFNLGILLAQGNEVVTPNQLIFLSFQDIVLIWVSCQLRVTRSLHQINSYSSAFRIQFNLGNEMVTPNQLIFLSFQDIVLIWVSCQLRVTRSLHQINSYSSAFRIQF